MFEAALIYAIVICSVVTAVVLSSPHTRHDAPAAGECTAASSPAAAMQVASSSVATIQPANQPPPTSWGMPNTIQEGGIPHRPQECFGCSEKEAQQHNTVRWGGQRRLLSCCTQKGKGRSRRTVLNQGNTPTNKNAHTPTQPVIPTPHNVPTSHVQHSPE